MPEVKPDIETLAKIKVVGIGGSGGSAINRMIQSKIRGVEFITVNTDVQALHYSNASKRLHIGKTTTKGLGAGMDPELGRKAAEESQNEIRDLLKGADMVFITCGLGGGTGSGASPLIAEIAKELGVLTVAVVTRPFTFEGAQRKTIADRAHSELTEKIDTIITIHNDKMLQVIDKNTSLLEAFEKVDDVLRQGVQGISELITTPGLINVDFADVKAVMKNQGSALMGIGTASGEGRAEVAARAAISSPFLDVSIDGARGILFTITGGTNLGMHEVAEAAKLITNSADSNAKIIFGAVIDKDMKDEVRITVIATGFENRATPLFTNGFGLSNVNSVHITSANKDVNAVRRAPTNGNGRFKNIFNLKTTEAVEPHREMVEVNSKSSVDVVQERNVALRSGVDSSDLPSEEDIEIPAFLRKKL